MDPRLNANLNINSPKPVQDVALAPPSPAVLPAPVAQMSPVSTSIPQAPQPVSAVVQPVPLSAPPPSPTQSTTEIVSSIPMSQPSQGPIPSSPPVPAQMPGNVQNQAVEPQDDLDKILQAVNNRVNEPLQPKPNAKSKILTKITAKKPSVPKTAKPVGAMAAVVCVVLVLSAVAVLAYRQGGKTSALANQPGKVGTSSASGAAIQSAGGTLVRPSDLDDYSQTLSTKLNALNDAQDFSADKLSDQVLGL